MGRVLVLNHPPCLSTHAGDAALVPCPPARHGAKFHQVWPGRYCSPRHRMPFKSISEEYNWRVELSMT